MAYQGEGGIQDIRARVYREKGRVTLDANGDATITFANPIPGGGVPFIHLTPTIASGANVVIACPVSGTWATDGNGDYLSVDIHGERAQHMPVTILNLSALNGRRVTEETTASGVSVDWMVY